jgi:hypothetical protein
VASNGLSGLITLVVLSGPTRLSPAAIAAALRRLLVAGFAAMAIAVALACVSTTHHVPLLPYLVICIVAASILLLGVKGEAASLIASARSVK